MRGPASTRRFERKGRHPRVARPSARGYSFNRSRGGVKNRLRGGRHAVAEQERARVMGRRYDEDETPRGEWRGLRFLGGLLLGLIVSGGVIAALSMNAPNPLHGEIAGVAEQET